MTISAGTRLGPYEILGSLGAGGMGEVYRARDTRLGRHVALKILPDVFAADPERRARFDREAQALAALTHPHIATIHGFEEKDGVRAIVLELVEGQTLAEMIAAGPLPIEDAVRLARQMAEALEAAHEQGIVHRDLKPANVKVTPDGAVKVLDFGLAKLSGSGDGSGFGPSPAAMAQSGSRTLQEDFSPTVTSPAVLTGAMVLMGTAGYMAPEQARGRVVDRRADIWAFGVVLYEMLTGKRAFEGDTVTEVAGAVIHKELDLAALPAATPPVVRMVVRRCLQKDPKQRFRDMGDVRLALDGAFAIDPAASPKAFEPPARGSRAVPIAAAALVAAALTGAFVWTLTRAEPEPVSPVRFDISPGPPGTLSAQFSISPDGRTLAFIARDGNQVPRLWVRSLASGESRMIVASEQVAFIPPFWTADSRYVGFLSEGDRRLKRIGVDGGPAEPVSGAIPQYSGATWNGQGTLLFSNNTGIVRVPPDGNHVALTAVDTSRAETLHLGPVFLPDGVHFLYLRVSNDQSRTGLYVGSIDSAPADQDQTRLLATVNMAVYAPAQGAGPGHVLFLRDGLLMAQPFDEGARQAIGEARPVTAEPIFAYNFLAAMSASANGTLIFLRGSTSSGTLTSVDRSGKATPLLPGVTLDTPRYGYLRVSPDGRRVAMVAGGQLWAYELDGRPPIKLTFGDERVYSSVWTKDGRRLVYERDAGAGSKTIFAVAADGSGSAPEPLAPDGHYHPHGWSANGRAIVATRVGGDTSDLVRFTADSAGQVQDLLATPQSEGNSASVSPDGRWLAYTTDSTGRSEVWVRPLEGPGAAVRVTPNGGIEPVWAKDGREIYYLLGSKVMAVPVDTAGAAFAFEPPIELFTSSSVAVPGDTPPSYDVTPDGRFIMLTSDDSKDVPISVILNWAGLLKDGTAAH